jgi:hypothetical protein
MSVNNTEIPRQQFFDAVDRMLRDARQNVPQITLRIDSIQLRRSDQATPTIIATTFAAIRFIILDPNRFTPMVSG